ncbi:hypothetical protein HY492_03365 [Candidatus Woesearchaeota archaeon]|nr:hypothetical protein [Candidatus Woesearchaeota archaeon]
MVERQKPLVAQQVCITDLIHGQLHERQNELMTVVTDDGREIARANIIGLVVDRGEGDPPGLVIDDGTERIPVRAFGQVPGIEDAALGMPVLVIGRPRQFGQERFLSAECVRVLESPRWIELRKRSAVKQPVKRSLLDTVRALDRGEGADIEEVLAQARAGQDELQRMLVAGDIFQVSPGKVKILE